MGIFPLAYLGCNYIEPEGAKLLVDALKHNCTLTILDLELNFIGNEGAKALGDVLKYNTTRKNSATRGRILKR